MASGPSSEEKPVPSDVTAPEYKAMTDEAAIDHVNHMIDVTIDKASRLLEWVAANPTMIASRHTSDRPTTREGRRFSRRDDAVKHKQPPAAFIYPRRPSLSNSSVGRRRTPSASRGRAQSQPKPPTAAANDKPLTPRVLFKAPPNAVNDIDDEMEQLPPPTASPIRSEELLPKRSRTATPKANSAPSTARPAGSLSPTTARSIGSAPRTSISAGAPLTGRTPTLAAETPSIRSETMPGSAGPAAPSLRSQTLPSAASVRSETAPHSPRSRSPTVRSATLPSQQDVNSDALYGQPQSPNARSSRTLPSPNAVAGSRPAAARSPSPGVSSNTLSGIPAPNSACGCSVATAQPPPAFGRPIDADNDVATADLPSVHSVSLPIRSRSPSIRSATLHGGSRSPSSGVGSVPLARSQPMDADDVTTAGEPSVHSVTLPSVRTPRSATLRAGSRSPSPGIRSQSLAGSAPRSETMSAQPAPTSAVDAGVYTAQLPSIYSATIAGSPRSASPATARSLSPAHRLGRLASLLSGRSPSVRSAAEPSRPASPAVSSHTLSAGSPVHSVGIAIDSPAAAAANDLMTAMYGPTTPKSVRSVTLPSADAASIRSATLPARSRSQSPVSSAAMAGVPRGGGHTPVTANSPFHTTPASSQERVTTAAGPHGPGYYLVDVRPVIGSRSAASPNISSHYLLRITPVKDDGAPSTAGARSSTSAGPNSAVTAEYDDSVMTADDGDVSGSPFRLNVHRQPPIGSSYSDDKTGIGAIAGEQTGAAGVDGHDQLLQMNIDLLRVLADGRRLRCDDQRFLLFVNGTRFVPADQQ